MAAPATRFPSLVRAVVLCLMVFGAVTLLAQDIHLQPAPMESIKPAAEKQPLSLHMAPLRVNVDLVLVPVTVTDSMNRPVLGLSKSDFSLSDGNRPQEIRYFSSEDTPISVGVLLDISGSMKDKIDLARDSLVEFFNDSHPEDDYFVVTFADRPEVVSDVTQSIGTLRDRLAQVTPKGRTALLDAIYLGMQKLKRAKYQRKALLIISDGGDNHSRFTAGEIREMVMESDVQIYGIGIYSSFMHTPEEWAGKRLLTEITEATGGRTITVANPRELPDAAAAISTDLRNQYMLGFAPGDQDRSGWRTIKVAVDTKKDGLPLHLSWRQRYQVQGQ